MAESLVQSQARLWYASQGVRLFRNNSGVLPDANGRPVRFGLANDSAAVNARTKSSDLIGWRPVVITPAMVGQTIARVVSVECKAEGWHLIPSDARGHAQKRWLDMVLTDGGEACFFSGIPSG